MNTLKGLVAPFCFTSAVASKLVLLEDCRRFDLLVARHIYLYIYIYAGFKLKLCRTHPCASYVCAYPYLLVCGGQHTLHSPNFHPCPNHRGTAIAAAYDKRHVRSLPPKSSASAHHRLPSLPQKVPSQSTTRLTPIRCKHGVSSKGCR